MRKIYIADIRGNVVNGKVSGHIVPVARNLKDVLSHDYDVKIAVGSAILNSFKKEECVILPYNVCSGTVVDKLRTFINFIVLLWKAKGSTIVLQQSTVITSFIAIALFHWWTSKLYLIHYDTAAINSKLKRLIYHSCKHKISGFICPNDRIGKAFGNSYCVVTDYIRTIIPPVKSFNERKWDICMVGGISKNKGVVEAAEFLAGSQYKVLIAGRINEYALEERLFEISKRYSNMECHFEFLSDEEYQYYIQNSKFCILNYKGCYCDRSSGAVLDNIFFGTPVVGRRCNAMDVVEENHVGYVYDSLQTLNLNEVITKENFDKCIANISIFYDKQKKYKEELVKFLSI